MFNTKGAAVVAVLTLIMMMPTDGDAQLRKGEWALGFHSASSLADGAPPDLLRFGAQAVFPLNDIFSVYPSAAFITDDAKWQASANVRLDPLPSHPAMPFYFGAGFSLIQFNRADRLYDVMLTGFEVKIGPFLPFVELQALGVINTLAEGIGYGPGPAFQAHIGVSKILQRR